jgi:hypothetical protein
MINIKLCLILVTGSHECGFLIVLLTYHFIFILGQVIPPRMQMPRNPSPMMSPNQQTPRDPKDRSLLLEEQPLLLEDLLEQVMGIVLKVLHGDCKGHG